MGVYYFRPTRPGANPENMTVSGSHRCQTDPDNIGHHTGRKSVPAVGAMDSHWCDLWIHSRRLAAIGTGFGENKGCSPRKERVRVGDAVAGAGGRNPAQRRIRAFGRTSSGIAPCGTALRLIRRRERLERTT